MKTVSSENLARFKAKCDETYQKKGSGSGITNAEVIEYAEQLPTASETSPNFVQTPDGTLYRKKAVESGGSLLGQWTFKDSVATSPMYEFLVSFTSGNQNFVRLTVGNSIAPNQLSYKTTTSGFNPNDVSPYFGSWERPEYKTIQITDISSLTNVDEFTQWLTANATGGGASVSYEYIAMQEVPTPTTADNGKVLSVANGAYALQEASGGGGTQLYTHEVFVDRFQLTFISNISTQFATIEQALNGLLSGTSFNDMGSAEYGAYLGWFKDIGSDRVYIVYTTNGTNVEYARYNTNYSISDSVTPL